MKAATLYAALTAIAGAAFVAALAVGYAPLGPAEIVGGLFAGSDTPSSAAIVMQDIRLPRALLGVLVGASLGLSGAALQGLLRNPLAEPGLIGASSMASLAAVIAFYFGFTALSPFILPLAGMAGALLAVALLYALAGREGSVLTLILAGVALTSFAGALTALAINLAASAYAALEITFWLLGSLSDRTMTHVLLAGPPMLLGWALLLSCGRALDALSLGEDTARSLGVSLSAARLRLVLGVALAVGAAVSVSGAIGFVGLVVPHLLRPFVGHEPGRLLLPSAIGGAALVLLADIGVRLIPALVEVKLGVLTALLGAPFFLALVLRTRRQIG
jgi:iron complex transport system permease protein